MNDRHILTGFFAILIIIPAAYSHTVTMNFEFSMSGAKHDTIHFNDTDYNASLSSSTFIRNLGKKYVSSSYNSSIFAAISAGEFIEAGFNSTRTASSYILQVTESDKGNRIIIGFSNGTYSNVDSVLDSVVRFKMILTTIGKFTFSFVPSNIYIRAEFDNADVFSRIKFSGFGNLEIRNNGKVNGLHNITLGVRL